MANTVGKVLAKKTFTIGSAVAVGMNAYSTVSDYKQQRAEGRGKVGSAMSATTTAIVNDAIGMKGLLTLGAIKNGPSMAVKGALKMNQVARSMDMASQNKPFSNTTFVDSQQAYTMRQAGMQLAQASKYNLQQSIMGNEASSMHRI